VESEVCFFQNTSQSSHSPPPSPQKAFKSCEKLTLRLQIVSEKRKDRGIIQAISLPMQED